MSDIGQEQISPFPTSTILRFSEVALGQGWKRVSVSMSMAFPKSSYHPLGYNEKLYWLSDKGEAGWTVLFALWAACVACGFRRS